MTWQDSSKKQKTCPLQRDEVFGYRIYEPDHLVTENLNSADRTFYLRKVKRQ